MQRSEEYDTLLNWVESDIKDNRLLAYALSSDKQRLIEYLNKYNTMGRVYFIQDEDIGHHLGSGY